MSTRVPNGSDSDDSMDGVNLTLGKRAWSTRLSTDLKCPPATCVSGRGSRDLSGLDVTGTGGLSETASSPATPHDTHAWNSLMTAVFQQQVQEIQFLATRSGGWRGDDGISETRVPCLGGEGGRLSVSMDEHAHTVKRPRLDDLTPSTVRAPARRIVCGDDSLSPEGVQRRLSLHLLNRPSGSLPALAEQVPTPHATPRRNTVASAASAPCVAASPNCTAYPSVVGTPTPTPLRRYGDPALQLPLPRDIDPPTESRPVLSQPGHHIPSPNTPLWAGEDNTSEGVAAVDEPESEIFIAGDSNFSHLDDDDVIARVPLRRRPPSFQILASPLMSLPDGDTATQGVPEAVRRMSADEWIQERRQYFGHVDKRPLDVVCAD